MILHFIPKMKSESVIAPLEVSKIVFCMRNGSTYAVEMDGNGCAIFLIGDDANDGVCNPLKKTFRSSMEILYKSHNLSEAENSLLFIDTLGAIVHNTSWDWNENEQNEFRRFFRHGDHDFGNIFSNQLRDRCNKILDEFMKVIGVRCERRLVRMKRNFVTLSSGDYYVAVKVNENEFKIKDGLGVDLIVPKENLEF